MTLARLTRGLLMVLGASIALASHAQETEKAEALQAPNPASLRAGWWSYFEGGRAEVEPRVTGFLQNLGPQIAELDPSSQVLAESDLKALRDNFTVYLDLLDTQAPEARDPPEAQERYTIEELLELGNLVRDARTSAAEAQVEADRARRIHTEVSRRRDAAFDAYVSAPAGDPRWLAAVTLIKSRISQAISSRRLELLTARLQNAVTYADQSAAQLQVALERLEPTEEAANTGKLMERIAASEAAVEAARENLRTAELEASTLELDTPQGRSQRRLQQQALIKARVELALTELALSRAQAFRWWNQLELQTVDDLSVMEEQELAWSELVRDIEAEKPDWQRETEDELLAVQSTERTGLEKDAVRLLDQRLETARDTLPLIVDVDDSIADLDLLGTAVDRAMARNSGQIGSWFSSLSLQVKTLFRRASDVIEYPLFSVGEAPVTGGDILRVLIILGIAVALSRGVRHAISRVAERGHQGSQASFYTIGRLTHYTIIIVAIFIALSSIGLDFSNLALVAGALSVGIGFGLQSIVSNFVSGLIILFEHTLRVGDYIELDTGITGTVKAINVRSTLINTNDNIDIVVPNSEFVTSRLTNWTLGERILRMRIPFGVAYGTDKELLKKAALEAAADVPYTLTHMKDREPDLWLVEYGDNSLNFLLLVWVNRQGARRPTRTRAAYLWALETKLSEYGIEIPFPQRDLHLRSGFPSGADLPQKV